MQLPPLITALRRHKAGVFLIGVQIALTLAVVSNLVFMVALRVHRVRRPTGMDEHNLFVITQQYASADAVGAARNQIRLAAMQAADLDALRRLPDVVDATSVSTLPLAEVDDRVPVTLAPGGARAVGRANQFIGDAHTIPTLGLRLIAGRNFDAAEVRRLHAKGEPPVVIVTRALARRLFPDGNALGRAIYLSGSHDPSVIVGIVARLQSSIANAPGAIAWDSLLLPGRLDGAFTMYAVRARPGRMRRAIAESRKALYALDPERVILTPTRFDPDGIVPYARWRAAGSVLAVNSAEILATLCLILLLVTGVGMAGLTSFWVRQRAKEIGIRRALGATRGNIRHYFQLENLVIAGGGSAVGVVLAIAGNLALLKLFQAERMPLWYVVIGVIVILLLGQLAVFGPARRASHVPPVVATRSV